jgi:hypothetical protein
MVAFNHHGFFLPIEIPTFLELAMTVLFTRMAKGEQISLSLPEVC